MATGELIQDDNGVVERPYEWQKYEETYVCKIAVIESEGCFESYVINLPGALSYGTSIDEAVRNAEESASGVLKSYKKDGTPIPWDKEGKWYETEEAPVLVKWILVNA